MSSFPLPPVRRRRLRALLAIAGAALASTALAASASAAPATGEVVLTLKKGAQSSLLREGVKATPRSGKGETQTVKLTVADLDPATRTVSSGTVLTLGADGKNVKLRDLQLKAGAKSTALSAKQGGKRQVFFRLQGTPLAIGAALSAKGSLTLTGSGAKALRDALGLDGISGGKLGSGSFSAFLSELKPAPKAPEEKPKGPEEPQTEAYPYATECPVPAVEGNPGFGGAPGKVAGIAPSPTFAPGISQEVTGTEIDWGFKDSFRAYVLGSPPPGTLPTLDGAVAHPNGPTMIVPGSYFEFPSGEGTYEPGSSPDHSDDKLVVEGTGTVLFCKSGHGFNIAMKDPTLTIDGADSRITATVGANMNGTWYPYQRADIADLDLTGVTPEVTDGGNTVVWKDIPAKLSADGELALGGIYKENDPLDKVTVKTSLERPLATQCTVAEGNGAPPALTFGLAPLPVLDSPVTGRGGTINWGLRRATRASVAGAPGGSFHLFGGATEGYPGNMGGAEGAPPAGGQGKFFRFPVSSYAYDANEVANPNDDQLIATSEASVGFCNPGGGNYGLVLAKPTLVIDGASSRLIANAYSFSGGSPNPSAAGWMGGRVELVDLDSTGIAAVAGSGTVSWGDVTADNTPIVNGIPVVGGFQTNALALAFLAAGGGTTSGGFDKFAAQIDLPAP